MEKLESKHYPFARVAARSILIILLSFAAISISEPSDSLRIFFITIMMCIAIPVTVGFLKKEDGLFGFNAYTYAFVISVFARLILFVIYSMTT